METFFPFDAGAGSNVTEQDWQKMARRWIKTGVLVGYLNQLAVTADGSAMQVTVAAGGAWIEGFYYESDATRTLAVGAANATNPRLDRVVARLDTAANTITTAVLAGTPAAIPTAPALTQSDTTYELLLATVTVPAAAGVIQSANVADSRTYAIDLPTHVAATDPHPQYLTPVEGNAAYLGKTSKAADSDLLDGLDSTAFVRTTAADALRTKIADNGGGANAISSTTYVTTSGSVPTVQFVAPPSGLVAVHLSCSFDSPTGRSYFSYELFNVTTNAVHAAPTDDKAVIQTPFSADLVRHGVTSYESGLTAGQTYEVRGRYRVASGTCAFGRRVIVVQPSP